MRALFLDRDGIINIDHGYVCSQANFEFVPGIFSLVEAANAWGLLVVVVTNQSGIARGLFTERRFMSLTRWMLGEFEKRRGRIDAVYHCPHHPDGVKLKYKMVCACRKPAPGMILRAAEQMDIDVGASILIGDSLSDVDAARAAGIGKAFLYGAQLEGHANRTLTSLCEHERILAP